MRNPNAKVHCPNDFVSSSGDRFHVTFSPMVNPDGTVELVESGRDDIQAMINSHRDSTDMAFILQRMVMGDTSVLSQKQPMFGDFTNVPKTYAEALQLVMDAEGQFMTLPLDVRNKFDNDFKKWFAQSGSDSWFEKMDSVIVKPDGDPNPELVEKEIKE